MQPTQKAARLIAAFCFARDMKIKGASATTTVMG
jgi:hypothetical protein